MEQNHAGQIAVLLNTRNQLVKNYDAKAILAAHAQFLFEVRDDQVVGCVEVKKVQWYQSEVKHLTVHKDYCRRGIAQALLAAATARAIQDRARILQCTIRDNNVESKGLFLKNGFVRTALFLYPDSGNNVGVYQKVISPPKAGGLSAATGC
jgi:ribosomal protein S18 acetylase RimI-like enzyme